MAHAANAVAELTSAVQSVSLTEPFFNEKTGKFDWTFGLKADRTAPDEAKTYVMGEPDRFGIRMVKGFKLLPHQPEMIQWMCERSVSKHMGFRGGMLCAFMGLGKTPCTLYFIMLLQALSIKTTGRKQPRLVICDKSAIIVWQTEPPKFFGHSMVVQLFKKDKGRFPKPNPNADIVIVTYDTILSVYKSPKHNKMAYLNLFKHVWSTIIIDESQRICNPETNLWEAMMHLDAEAKYCLTATPIRNTKDDLLAQLEWVGYLGCPDRSGWTYQKFLNHDLKRVVLVRNLEDAGLKLPTKHVHHLPYDLNDKEMLLYDLIFELFDSVVKCVENDLCAFAAVLELFTRLRQVSIAPHLITKSLEKRDLRQMIAKHQLIFDPNNPPPDAEHKQTSGGTHVGSTNGNLYGTSEHKGEKKKDFFSLLFDRYKILLPTAQLTNMLARSASLNEYVTSKALSGYGSKKLQIVLKCATHHKRQGHKIIIFSSFVRPLKILREMLEKEGLSTLMITGDTKLPDRKALLDRFKTSGDVLLMNLKVGSTALTITCARVAIFIEPHWAPVVRAQAVARMHRIGQTEEVHVYIPLANGTMEWAIDKILGTYKIDIADCFLHGKEGVSMERDTLSLKMIKELREMCKQWRNQGGTGEPPTAASASFSGSGSGLGPRSGGGTLPHVQKAIQFG